MRFISTHDEFRSEFKHLIQHYQYFDWAVAWATTGFPAFESLIKYRSKIRRIIVGTQFHQTAPDFIEAFTNTPGVRFRLDQNGLNGVFHPKIYLFSNGPTDWKAVIGSANFTNGAFFKNVEHAVVIDSSDISEGISYDGLITEIDRLWQGGRKPSVDELDAYRMRWRTNSRLLDRASGHSTNKTRPKSIYDCDLLKFSWDEFFHALRESRDKYFDDRIAVLQATKRLWSEKPSLFAMSAEERKKICGTASEKTLRWRLFGSMQGAFVFKAALRDNNIHLLTALDQVPLSGEIHQEHYAAYIRELRTAFAGGKDFEGLAVATRLLCLRRPDVFVCVDRKNKKKLLGTLGVTPSQVAIDSYWDTVIEPLKDTRWWQSKAPSTSGVEQIVWASRIAMVDVLFYEE